MPIFFPIKLGDAGQYELSENALNHILYGNTAIRPQNATGARTHDTVLSGGLHTYEGWEQFISLHPKVVHLLQYNVDHHDDWFYARELQNGVITLKIPRQLFTSGAANITKKPDLHYKSGYLWKTLFPLLYTKDDIIKAISDALTNIDREDSKYPTDKDPMGVIYGYANVQDPFTALKLRIQLQGHQIHSAFPAWEQPSTGNNGKAYSHEHSISFQIAESTLKFMDFQETQGPVFPNQKFNLLALIELTPDFIRQRPKRDPAVPVDEWHTARQSELFEVAKVASPLELAKIETYLLDYVCTKDPFFVQRGLYLYNLAEIDDSRCVFNAAQLIENIYECLWVFSVSDNHNKTRRAIDIIERFLSMAIIHTGGLNTLLYKRLLGKFLVIAFAHHEKNAINEIIAALVISPCRAALYTELNLNQFVELNDNLSVGIIGTSNVTLELKPEHLFEFLALNLGENYLITFSKEQRLTLAREMFSSHTLLRLATDSMSFLQGSDFNFLMPTKFNLSQMGTKTPPSEDDLIAMTKDYIRMLIIQRQRVVLEDPKAYKEKPDYNKIGTQQFSELIKQKSKYKFIVDCHKGMLKELMNFADTVSYKRLKSYCENALATLPTESMPLPKPIPKYINSWQTNHMQKVVDESLMIETILGR